MQGDVLSPLVSSNMVDKHVGKVASETGIIYMFKDKVKIPPLAMQDDTLGISECGVQTTVMNAFLNTRTSLMNLQYGSDKCIKMHIGENHNVDICSELSVDSWKEEVVEDGRGKKKLVDKYIGKEVMENVTLKKYLGDIISSDGKKFLTLKIGPIRLMEILIKLCQH